MKRALLLATAVFAIIVIVTVVAACGDDGGGGLAVLGGSPSASPAPSATTSTASPSPSATSTAPVTPSPSFSGSGGDPFAGRDVTAEDLTAYLAEVEPIYEEVVRVETIAGDMLVEVSVVPDDSWDTAADRTEGYADQIAMQQGLWLAVDPPAGFSGAHETAAESFSTEADMLDLLATQLRSRTWDVVKGTKDVNRMGDDARRLRDSYRADLETLASELGVRVPWEWE